MKLEQYEAAVESILFAMGGSVEISRLAAALDLTERDVRMVVQNLQDRMKRTESGIQIIELEDAYQMCTKPEMYEYLIRITKQPKRQVLTDVLLETLSIVAYRQPVTRIEIEKIRGVSCEHAVNRLIEYGLIQEVGRLDAPGRPILFGTTEEFLRCFGMQSVDDLPLPETEMTEELKQEAQEEAQLRLEL